MINLVFLEGISRPSEEDFISKLIPNWVSFLAQILALLVLIVVVIIFAYKPVKKIINTRQNYIEDNIKSSEQAKANALQNETKSEEKILASNKLADSIITTAQRQALQERNKIITETEVMVKKMKDDAEVEIERSKLEAKEEIRKEMVDVALLTSSEILKRNITDEDNEKLANDFIKEIDK
ncbi:MAG: F0F1 ATP synthase subunit B [Bacilli bacterium]|nr:F0F1 ATP synthase subunit B [Bacilli bacterium]